MRPVLVTQMVIPGIMLALLIVPGIANSDSAVDPIPIYGYLYGNIQSDAAHGSRALDGVVYVSQGDVTYYKPVNNSGSYGYIFYLPAGSYTIYAQHMENGSIYESDHVKITVTGFSYMQVTPTDLVCSLDTPASAPKPSAMPCADQYNTISGTVETKDGKPYEGATVSLCQASDSGARLFHRQAGTVTRTDENGHFEIDRVRVTSDDGLEVESRKDVYLQIDYADSNGTQRSIHTETRSLYYPDTLVGLFDPAPVQHNITFGDDNGVIYLPDAIDGWVSIASDPAGASIYVDGHRLVESNGKPMVTPATIYLGPGRHEIRLSMGEYADQSATVDIAAGMQHEPVSLALDKQAFPSMTVLALAAVILMAALGFLLIAALILIVLVIWKRHAIKKTFVSLVKGLR